MPYETTNIEDVYLFTPKIHEDERGLFFESFRYDIIHELGLNFQVAQVNNSVSQKGVLRGIHLKKNPPGQRKFVSVQEGSIYDVVVDLRPESSTFGKWQGFELNNRNHQCLLIGNGIGHAFLALENNTRVNYLCDTVYEAEIEYSINPFSIDIDWNSVADTHAISKFRLSDKDKNSETFEILFSFPAKRNNFNQSSNN